MRICIIGWYGTETIGDRAILAGLLGMLYEKIPNMELFIGSIYPFFTERTLFEDKQLYEQISGGNFKGAVIFDTRNISELDRYIKQCDLIIMGGGPLCDMWCMYMVEYALRKAKKLKKRTAVLGCGLGPLVSSSYLKSARNILEASDAVVLRDNSSYEWAQSMNLCKDIWIKASIDPAAILCEKYKELIISDDSKYIALNLREFPMMYAIDDSINKSNMDGNVISIIKSLNSSIKVKLIPMHCFAVGNDDRTFLNQISEQLSGNIEVINDPPTLGEVMSLYKNAVFAIGMRFHSVVLQTMLNGNNYIIDYTHPQTGKIGGFIEQIGGTDFYRDRCINIQENSSLYITRNDSKFVFDKLLINNFKKVYYEAITILIN